MLITEIELKKCWEYLEFETRYFTPVEKYLTQQIDFKNTGSVNFDKQFFSELKKAKKAGLDKIERVVYDKADTIEKVPNLYKYKLEQFKKRSKSLIELDFCDIEMNHCDKILLKIEPLRDEYFGPFSVKINQQSEEIALIVKLIKAYRFHVQCIISQSSENKNRYDHITHLRNSGNRYTNVAEFGNINSNIQSFIRKEFKYFEGKHNSISHKIICQVYYKDAESIYLVAQTSTDKVKLASIELGLIRREIEALLDKLETNLVYLKSDYPEDCLKLMQSIEAIQVNYKAILSGNGVKIENTYNYELFKNRFELWEEKYRTSLLTTKFVGQQIKDNHNARNSKSIKQGVAAKLKVPQIALIHVYEGIQITRVNAGEIAAKHGYTAKNSGEGLYQDYLKYVNVNDRKAKTTAETKKTLKNKIELFESVVNHLLPENKQRAIDEINILKTIFETEYQ